MLLGAVVGVGRGWGRGLVDHPVCDEGVYVYVLAFSAMTPRCQTLPGPGG